MSKKVTRLHGEDSPRAPERGRNLMSLQPRRALDSWEVSDETGLVTIRQPKGLGRVEKRLARTLKGSDYVNRQLDEYGSAIWQLCDGNHTVEQIARSVEDRFHEQFEPALPRTIRFIELLARRGLVRIAPTGAGSAAEPMP